uniref:Uncharacterized protein n=1 Tax=Suricata suricatta TaxID=37032 RepID=A0A673TWY6_SURSU
MKEVKEQCEERIEEVTKKGNEAVASRDLNEKKDQAQQLQGPGPQEADLPQAEVPQVKGNVPSNGEPQTPAPSSEVALDLKRQGEREETNEIQVASEEALRRRPRTTGLRADEAPGKQRRSGTPRGRQRPCWGAQRIRTPTRKVREPLWCPKTPFHHLPLTLEGPLGSFLNGSLPSVSSHSFIGCLTKWEARGKSRVGEEIHWESAGASQWKARVGARRLVDVAHAGPRAWLASLQPCMVWCRHWWPGSRGRGDCSGGLVPLWASERSDT